MSKQLPTWVFVCGTYRTGSTTLYQMVRDVVHIAGVGEGIGYHTENKLREHDQPKWRYIVCKVFEYLPDGFRGETSHGEILHRQGRIRAIMSVRDPRDIIVSMRKRHEARLSNGKPDPEGWDFKKTATENLPTWLGWSLKWADLGPEMTLLSKFEQFTQNLSQEVRRIAAHLDVELPPDIVGEIARGYTIDAMQARKTQAKETGEREDPWLPSVPGVVFGTSGMHRTWLNGPERRMVEESCREYMERFGYR